MSDREHTDPKALDHFYNLHERAMAPRPADIATAPAWYRRLWRWITEDLFAPFEPVEPLEPLGRDSPVRRRLRIYKRSVKLAKRLRWYRQDEARDILITTTMLLGFEKSRAQTRRERVRS